VALAGKFLQTHYLRTRIYPNKLHAQDGPLTLTLSPEAGAREFLAVSTDSWWAVPTLHFCSWSSPPSLMRIALFCTAQETLTSTKIAANTHAALIELKDFMPLRSGQSCIILECRRKLTNSSERC